MKETQRSRGRGEKWARPRQGKGGFGWGPGGTGSPARTGYGSFEIASAGKPQEFQEYVEGTLRRR